MEGDLRKSLVITIQYPTSNISRDSIRSDTHPSPSLRIPYYYTQCIPHLPLPKTLLPYFFPSPVIASEVTDPRWTHQQVLRNRDRGT